MRAIGIERNRSKTPLSMSSRICVPVAMHAVNAVCTMMPVMIVGRYALTLPAIAPPKI